MTRIHSASLGLIAIAMVPGVLLGQRVYQDYQPVEGLLRIGPDTP